METVTLIADKKKWKKSRKELSKILGGCKPAENAPPLDLDGLLKQIYAVQKERAKNPPTRNLEIYFPNERAMRQFQRWITKEGAFDKWLKEQK